MLATRDDDFAWTIAYPAPRRLILGAVFLGTASLSLVAPYIASALGRSVGLAQALIQLPVVLVAILASRFVWRDPLFWALVVLFTLTCTSLAWSSTDTELAVSRLYYTGVALSWGVVFAVFPTVRRDIAHLAVVYVPIAIVSHYTGSPLPLVYSIAAVALWLAILELPAHRLRGLAIVFYLTCLAVLVTSTYRAVAIGALVGLLVAAPWERKAVRAAAVLAVVGAVAVLMLATPQTLTRPARADLANRYSTGLETDRLSGRLDIWEPVLRYVWTYKPPWVWAGVGIGDVDQSLARITGRQVAALGEDGIYRIHSHDTPLEVFIATGVLGLGLLTYVAYRVLRRFRQIGSSAVVGLWVTIAAVALANVPAYDAYGGAVLIGIGLGYLLSPRLAS